MLAAPAGIVTVIGIVTAASLTLRLTTTPAEPNVAVNDTVHVPFIPVLAMTGVHVSDDSAGAGADGGVIVAVCVMPK